ncbi:hypothetical protein CKM354_000209100 [Cercospora kikuchii]|uniref:Apple domain-containing protein n=1 Tax=Cercospora kikuchii TaxID=84275 RepID=A0A9P3CHG5_9PEZI|nr:uncharacterized protein CKM354_000209100 [Cercospora kikuchii]GIZ38683.1 hypothetical protein CKM354_000209100 [Cercospora kikuchii]
MRLFAYSSIVGLALANPVAELQARQLNAAQSSSCRATHTSACMAGTSMAAASAFCKSRGHGTFTNLVRTTGTQWRTVMTTLTSTTGTSTITAARVSTTITSVRTSMTTQTTTFLSTTTSTIESTLELVGTIESCPGYTPAATAIDPANTGSPDEGDPSSGTPTVPSGPTAPATVVSGAFSSCPSSDLEIIEFNNGGGDYQIYCENIENYDLLQQGSTTTFSQCLNQCVADVPECHAITWVPSNGMCLYKRSRDLSHYQRSPNDAQGVIPRGTQMVSAGRVSRRSGDPWPPRLAYAKRDVAAPVLPRQATPVKPACLAATNSAQTVAACNCVIPVSTTTVTSTSSTGVTSTRTISSTRNILATTTTTPTTTFTTVRTTVMTRLRSMTKWDTTTTTNVITTVNSWVLAPSATPSAFYIVDQDMAFAEWPADADEIFYHVQYDWDQSDDEYAPTLFSLTGDKLSVADLTSSDDGAAEGYSVVGQEYSGPGMQIMALADAGGYQVPSCRIEPTEDGKCPLMCNLGTNDVNSRNSDGLWTLLPHGSESEFTNYVLAADVQVDEGGGDNGGGDAGGEDPSTPALKECSIPANPGPGPFHCTFDPFRNFDGYVNNSAPIIERTLESLTACRDLCDYTTGITGCFGGNYNCQTGLFLHTPLATMKRIILTLLLFSQTLATPTSDTSSTSDCDTEISTSSNPSGPGSHIEDVFTILTDDRWSSSCSNFHQPSATDQNLKALNLGWRYLHELNSAAIYALSKEGYENDEENRRLATRFFGILPGVERKRKGVFKVEEVEVLGKGRLEGEKMGHARKWYSDVQKILDNKLLPLQRPWLFCDSDFMELQTGEDLVQNEDRYHVLKTQDSYMTLEDALMYHPHRQAVLGNNWLFKSDVPGTMYIPYSKAEYPAMVQNSAKGPAPFSLDERGRSHECGSGVDGITRPAREIKLKTNPGLAWTSEFVYRVIMVAVEVAIHNIEAPV